MLRHFMFVETCSFVVQLPVTLNDELFTKQCQETARERGVAKTNNNMNSSLHSAARD